MKIQFLILILIILSIGFYNPSFSNASKINDLKVKIEERNQSVSKLEEEIQKYQKEIEKVGKEKKTLSNEIYRLNLNRKKLITDIRLTDNKIEASNLNIQKLALNIGKNKTKIYQNNKALAGTIRLINEYDSNSLVEILLSQNELSDFWNDVDGLQKFQIGVRQKTKELKNLKENLEFNKKETEIAERKLINFRSELSDQKKIVDYNKREKNQLLYITKNKESNYVKLLAKKKKLRDEVLNEISSLESQLKIEIDPNSIPQSAYGVLKWPLAKIRITQYFGKTHFSTKNSQVYSGHGHNGVDFRASPGTKVMAALGGVVKGTGDTDSIPPKCYSYGRWVLIQHNNGLSTIYAHLSLIKVIKGETVNTGEVIGYSGNTGYTTGPHLHFGVYATKGVKIQQFTRSINCKDKFIPIASLNAYLNPLSYLPKYKN